MTVSLIPVSGDVASPSAWRTSHTKYAQDFSGSSKEQQISAAIAAAVADGFKYVSIPKSMLPYDNAAITHNSSVVLIREGFDQGVSSDRGDANVTLVMGTDVTIQRFATTLTANRTVTLPSVGVSNGDQFRIVRTGLGAFTLDVGGLKTIPSATAAFVDVAYDGAAWRLTGYGAL